jgi:integrase
MGRVSGVQGSVRRRGPSWEVRVYAGRDPATGARRYLTRSVRGSPADAERARRELLDAVDAGTTDGRSATFGELCEAWLANAAARLAPNTVAETRRILDRWLLPELGDRPLRRLRAEHLDSLYRRLLTGDTATGKALSPATVARIHAIARRALNVGRRWGWLSVNPADLATPPRSMRRVIRPPAPDDVRRLLAAARTRRPDLATFLVVAATTGARRGELCGLRWDDVDLDPGRLHIVRAIIIVDGATVEAPTKTRRARRIALDPATVAVLRAHRQREQSEAAISGVTMDEGGFVFHADACGRRPWRPDSTTRAFRRLAIETGLEGVRLHDLRHYVATQLLTSGVDVRTVAGRLGHANPSTTLDVYAAFVPQADRDAAEVMAQLICPAAKV